MDEKLKIFKTDKIDKNLDFNCNGISKFGFIIPNKYNDEIIYLPSFEKESKIHHADVLKFTMAKLFQTEKEKNFTQYKKINNNKECYMDSDEIAYSSFMASQNTIVFLNTGDEIFNSGILFMPNNLKDDNQKQKVNEILDYLYEGNDETSQIVLVPPINDTLTNFDQIKVYDLDTYKNTIEKEKSK